MSQRKPEPGPLGVHVVTDDDRVREAARSLPPSRFAVSYSATAPRAIDEVRRTRPSVAVLELRLGEYGGFALAKDLRALPSMAELPLVMLCDRPHDRWICRQAGARAVIVKPMPDPMMLLDALETALAPTQ